MVSQSEASKKNAEARRVFVITLILNVAVALSKLLTGLVVGSLSMQADGFHSALDASSNVLGLAALFVAAKPPDANHPYGHRKFEAFGAIAISFMMFFASFEVLGEAIKRLAAPGEHHVEATALSFGVMIASTLINVCVSRYESRKAKELNNALLSADATHTASDVFVSLTVIFTLLATHLNMPWLDIVGSVGIVGVIFYAGFGIITAHLGYLMDEAIIDPTVITGIVMQVPGVKGCHKIRSRGQKDHMFIDLHVQVDKNLSIKEAHEISFAVEEAIARQHEGFVDVLVHIEDDNPPLDAKPEAPAQS